MILIVDDEPSTRQLVRMILERGGYEIMDAGSGAAALEAIKQRKPEILLTDIVMPGMSGLALAAQAHQIAPSLPVIFMSGFASQYEDELSGSVCLRKPFTPGQLLAAVSDVLELKRTQRAEP
jgi:CheY-like chemotaxis protein